MAVVLLLGPARAIGGVASLTIDGRCVDEITAVLVERFGAPMQAVLEVSRIWVDGEPASGSDRVGVAAEVSVLPPVSGG